MVSSRAVNVKDNLTLFSTGYVGPRRRNGTISTRRKILMTFRSFSTSTCEASTTVGRRRPRSDCQCWDTTGLLWSIVQRQSIHLQNSNTRPCSLTLKMGLSASRSHPLKQVLSTRLIRQRIKDARSRILSTSTLSCAGSRRQGSSCPRMIMMTWYDPPVFSESNVQEV